jgi:hypothetical protein
MLKKPSLEPRTKNEQEEIMPNKSHEPYRMYSPSLDAMMREVLHTLGNIDFANEIELDKVEKSAVEPKLKEYIKDKIRASLTWTSWTGFGGNSTANPSLPERHSQ